MVAAVVAGGIAVGPVAAGGVGDGIVDTVGLGEGTPVTGGSPELPKNATPATTIITSTTTAKNNLMFDFYLL